jgi:hypothetical protein
MTFTIACLDMAGTTVRDDGVVLDAFESAISGRAPRPAQRLTVLSR